MGGGDLAAAGDITPAEKERGRGDEDYDLDSKDGSRLQR